MKSETYLLEILKLIPLVETLGTLELLSVQDKLFHTYVNLIPVCQNPQHKKYFRNRAKLVIRDVNLNSHEDAKAKAHLMEQKFAVIDCLEERERIANRIVGPKGIKEKRLQNFREVDVRLHNLENAVNAKTTTSTNPSSSAVAKPQISSDCYQIQALANNHDAQNARECIKALEQKLSLALSKSQGDATLFDIYEQIFVFVGLKDLLALRNSIIMAGIESRNMQEALDRVIVLTQLELAKQGNISTLTRFLQASLKSLCGDSSEWIAYEEERVTEAHRKQKAKTERNVHLVTSGIERARATGQEAKPINNRNKAKQSTLPPKGKEPKESEAPQEIDLPHEQQLRTKEEKIRNHELALKKRAEKKLALETTAGSVTQSISEPKLDVKEEEKLPLIRELYVLTSGAKKVDTQIEMGTWKFTRDELKAYFKALGCEPEEGGKHSKVPLPTAMKIVHNGILISVINDLGGALTLPRWDKSTNNGCVPSYLRCQILEAREKLVLLALKTAKELKQETNQKS